MKFFFPDSQDQIDPGFDFGTEEHPALRVRQRDDLYAHEALDGHVIDGLLVSKAIVDGTAGGAGKYTAAQRNRLYRVGVRHFFRLDQAPGPPIQTMGDCGAFSYIDEEDPAGNPGSGHRLLRRMRIRPGHLSRPRHLRLRPGRRHRPAPPSSRTVALPPADHARPGRCLPGPVQGHGRSGSNRSASRRDGARPPMRRRSAASRRSATRALPLAAWFRSRRQKYSPASGKSPRRATPDTQLHLLGITRCSNISEFASYGVTSFDSTSAFRQAFKDDKDNYHTVDRTYTAIRVPQVDGLPRLKKQILAGKVDQEHSHSTGTGMPAGAARIRRRRDKRPASDRRPAALQRDNRASGPTMMRT